MILGADREESTKKSIRITKNPEKEVPVEVTANEDMIVGGEEDRVHMTETEEAVEAIMSLFLEDSDRVSIVTIPSTQAIEDIIEVRETTEGDLHEVIVKEKEENPVKIGKKIKD